MEEWNLVKGNTAVPKKALVEVKIAISRPLHEVKWAHFCTPINFKIPAGYNTCADTASLPYSYLSIITSFHLPITFYSHPDTPILWSSFRSFPHSQMHLISREKMHLTRRVSVWNGSSAVWRKRLGLWKRRLNFFNNTVALGNRYMSEWGRRREQLSEESYKDIFIQVKINTVKPLKSNFGKTS